ncbi:hypothetical protein PybrP1_013021 [[Pythium] brassicae (nom. inval.)]|nr:hypothetical protein PybrP1_013021 [[Pythium] brassicae (nom. inval.)]
MASSPVSANSHRALLKYAHVTLNTTFLSTPMTATLNENLLQREVFDYDFSRERVFLEIAAAEMNAKAAVAARPAASSMSADDADDDLVKKSSSLSLGSHGERDVSYQSKAAAASDSGDEDDDVAAAIRASLREY